MTFAAASQRLEEELDWDSRRVRLGSAPFETAAFLGRELGITPDIEASLEACKRPIWAWRSSMNLPLNLNVDAAKASAYASKLASSWDATVKDASFHVTPGGEVVVSPHTYGCEVDVAGLILNLTNIVSTEEIPETMDVPARVTPPNVLSSELEAFLPMVPVSEYSTRYADKNNRAHNIALASSILSPTTIWPGEVFSFNRATGPRSKEMGYLKAGVIMGDDLVDDYGGGVCQVSTTLYVAMLKAGLKVQERYAHGLPVAYVPLGFDATVSYDYLDMKMKNTTNAPYVITIHAEGGVLTAKVYGQDPGDFRIEVESSILKEIPAEPATKEPAEPGGELPTLRPGFLVETRLRYMQGDTHLRTERLNTSMYPPQKP